MATNRQIKFHSPLDDELMFVSMDVSEELGRISTFSLVLYSKNEELKIDDILGQNITVSMELSDEEHRYFNGYVSRFSQVNRTEGGYVAYEATVSPWLWLLTRTSNCRVYAQSEKLQKIPDIIKAVFDDNGFSDYDFSGVDSSKHRDWEYCVQYRETDFNFVNRLMEQEGIYYYFKHEDGKHIMWLVDDMSAHEPIGGESELPYHLHGIDQMINVEHVSHWHLECAIQPGSYAHTDYDFKKPKTSLAATRVIERNHEEATREIFDYPGEFVGKETEADHGEQAALVRIQDFHTGFEQVNGETDARNMAVGGLFSLSGHPREDQNREYLVVGANYNLTSDEYSSGSGSSEPIFKCSFSAIDSSTAFRPSRSTPKPMVQGPQTAVVVGTGDSSEIYPDEYGRIKVQFHWDRYGTKDENSSCWIRVAQSWAGSGWGTQFIPRVGHEVVVEFLEGDPDQPLVTGSVYNADNMPPYSMPDNKTQSGIKTRSTQGGGASNFNEIKLEDKKGSEEFYVQAEKDYNQLVKNDRGETIGNDRSLSVGHNKSETVANDKSIEVGANHTESIVVNKTLKVGASHSETIGSNMTITVGSNLTETVAINYAETVGAAMELTIGAAFVESVGAFKQQSIGANKSEDIGNNKNVSIGGNKSEDVDGGKTVKVGKDLGEKIDGAHSEAVTKEYSLTAKKVSIVADDEILLKTGKASIAMKKDGTITISGKDIAVKGSGNITMKATKILQN
ncbi:MAG: type VI secretion system Vgr family protein [Pseudomonadales bacterium]